MSIESMFLVFLIGLVIIVKGGDFFIDAAVWFSLKTGISYVIIGATIVSIATTLPEFFVSIISSNEGFAEMSFGNAIGSFICNIGFVIGITSLVKPIKIKDNLFKYKGSILFLYLGIFYIFALDNLVDKFEGMILLLLIIPFIFFNIFENKSTNIKANKKDIVFTGRELFVYSLKFFLGGFSIIYGAHLLVESGVGIANFFNVSRKLISLTLLAFGTSLPELVTTLSAIKKSKDALSVGNILGANILNISMVIGGAAIVNMDGLYISNESLMIDIPFAFLFSSLFIFSVIFKEKVSRFTGLLMISLYILYISIIF